MTLDRIAFARGDRLEARDLADVHEREAALHALHVRTLHRTMGIALGFAVETAYDALAVVVSPGLAYDALGRAIVLAAGERVPVPGTDGVHRLVVDVGPRWRWLSGVGATAAGVLVATVEVTNGQANDADPAGRPAAAVPPRIGSGRAMVPQSSGWSSAAVVDTSHAGFVGAPHYFAQAVGPAAGTSVQPAALGPLLSIRNERRDRFERGVLLPGLTAPLVTPIPVVWIGVETYVPAR